MSNRFKPREDQIAEMLPILKNSVLFKDMPENEIRTLCLAASLQHFAKDRFLFYEDDPATHVFVLVEGVMHLNQLTPKGQQVIIHYLSPGDEVGILALFPGQGLPGNGRCRHRLYAPQLVWPNSVGAHQAVPPTCPKRPPNDDRTVHFPAKPVPPDGHRTGRAAHSSHHFANCCQNG